MGQIIAYYVHIFRSVRIRSEHLQDFDDWHVAFHGTASKDIEKILNSESEMVALPCKWHC